MRSSQLTAERRTLLASIAVQGATLLALVTEWNPEVQRILGRIANIQAEVGRRLRAGSGTPDEDGDDGEDDDEPNAGPGEDPADALPIDVAGIR